MLVDEVGNGTRNRGDYALLEVMGDPGCEVFRARTRDGRSVVLRFWRSDSELETQNALGLLDVAMRVQHPMLATVYRCERFPDGSLRVVSEYVPGRSLDAWVGELGLPPLTIGIDFVRRLALALADAHRLGVTHHALYPGNIVVLEPETREHGRIAAKLLDLGIARSMRTATRFEAAHFLAPELLAQELDASAELQHVEARMNVYSCGCLLHYLSTGQPPYQSDSLENLRAVHRSGRPAVPARLNPKIPADLERVICQALALDPKRRTPDMAALARGLSYVESQWRSSSVRNKAQPPPLPAREESPAPQPSAAVTERRLAPAIAAALSLRPVPQRNSTPPEAPEQQRRRSWFPAPPPPANEAIELEVSQVALEPAAELATSRADEAIVIEPIGVTDPIQVANDAAPAAPAVSMEPSPSSVEAPAHVEEQAVAAVALEPSPSVAEAPVHVEEQAVAAVAGEPSPSVAEVAVFLEEQAVAVVASEPAPSVHEAAALEDAQRVAASVIEPAPSVVAAATTTDAPPSPAAAASVVEPVDIVDAATVVSRPVARSANPSTAPDFAAAVDAAAERISNPEIGKASEIHAVTNEPSVVISAAVFRNSLSPVEVAGRRRSDGLPRRVVSDVVVPPRVPVAPVSRRWRWGAAALAGASVYWLLISLHSSEELTKVSSPTVPAAVARAPEPLPAPPPATSPAPSEAPVAAVPAAPPEVPREPKRRAAQPQVARHEPAATPATPAPAPTPDPLDTIRVELPPKQTEHVIPGEPPRAVRLQPVWRTPNVVAFSETPQPPLQPIAARRSAPGNVRNDSIAVHGALTTAQAARAIDRISPQMRQCYLDLGPAGALSTQIELLIDDVGRVRNLQVRGAAPALAECVVAVSRKLMSGQPFAGAAKIAWNAHFE